MRNLNVSNRPEIRCIILRAPSDGSKVFSAGHYSRTAVWRSRSIYDDLRQITRMIQNSRKPSFRWWKVVVFGVALTRVSIDHRRQYLNRCSDACKPRRPGVRNTVGIHSLTPTRASTSKELVLPLRQSPPSARVGCRHLSHVVEVDELEDFTLQMAHPSLRKRR